MPVYDYKCRTHGLFHALATLDDYAEPRPCPECAGPAPRVIVLPPEFRSMDPLAREAERRNEKSRHEPMVSTPDSRAGGHHQHGSGCGCNSPSNGKSQLFYTAEGNKMFPGMRPWMISH